MAYLNAGPLNWAMFGFIMYVGRRKMLLMSRPPHPIVGNPPLVNIIIPAKDEGARIRGCLQSALDQDYPNFQVLAIDDRSADQTGAVMDEMAATDQRLKVIHKTTAPPPGWTGKNNALWVGQQQAAGEWMLFVDSDMILEKDALSVAMSVVLRKEFDMISLLPRLECHTISEAMLIPLAAGAASAMYLVALTNNSRLKNTAFGNGQFLLINRRAYDAIGGHETVRDRFCEDVEIAVQLKRAGLRPRVSWGTDFASVRMYSSLGAIFRGWSRIYYAARVGSPWRILAALLFVILCCFTAYAAVGWGIWREVHPVTGAAAWGPAWLIAGAVHLAVMTWFLSKIYEWSGTNRRNALWFPVAGSMLVLIFLKALKMCITKKVEWRGTAYSHVMAQDLAAAANDAKAG
jgi:glycosyltransferase involved in cell wall biosynthesis